MLSRSAEKQARSTQPYPDEQVFQSTGSDFDVQSDTTPSSDDSVAVSQLAWPNADSSNDLIWDPQSFDLSANLSSSDTSWATPEQVPVELNEFLRHDDVLNATFADDFQIAVPELDLLRAAYQIANRLQSTHLLFDMNAESVFITNDCSSWISSLPKNLQPTIEQLTLPHHPLLDILPWPSVRKRLINMYSLPSDVWPRHPDDGCESTIVRMVYDMEDNGVRVSGPDPTTESSWEIEQRFFNAWWWALDQGVVRNSNNKRIARGLPMLCGR